MFHSRSVLTRLAGLCRFRTGVSALVIVGVIGLLNCGMPPDDNPSLELAPSSIASALKIYRTLPTANT